MVRIIDLEWAPDLSQGTLNKGEQLGWKAKVTLGEGEEAERAGAEWKGPIVGPKDVTYHRSCYSTGVSCTVTNVGDNGPGCEITWSMSDTDKGVDFAALAERDGPFRFEFNDLDGRRR